MTKIRPGQRVDVEQVLVLRRAGEQPIDLVEQPAVGRGQDLPGDGAEERRRHERGRHQRADGAGERQVGARHQPAHRRRDRAADDADETATMTVVISGSTKSGSVNSWRKLASVKRAGADRRGCSRPATTPAGRPARTAAPRSRPAPATDEVDALNRLQPRRPARCAATPTAQCRSTTADVPLHHTLKISA